MKAKTNGASGVSANALVQKLPANLEAERLLLGEIFINPVVITEIASQLTVDDFYLLPHKYVYSAMLLCREREIAVGVLQVADILKRDGRLESVGGYTGLQKFFYGLSGAETIQYAISDVQARSRLRQLLAATQQVIANILDEGDAAEHLLSAAAASLLTAAHQAQSPNSTIKVPSEWKTAMAQEFIRWRDGSYSLHTVKSGIPELDDKLAFGAFAGGDLVIIAARTSVGKTALAIQIARHIGLTSTGVYFASLEQSERALLRRLLIHDSQIPSYQVTPEMYRYGHDKQVMAALERLERINFFIEDKNRDLIKILMNARRAVQSKGATAIIVDYLQLARTNLNPQDVTREREVAFISAELKSLAMELDVPVIALCQLSRKAVTKTRPDLDDLRESGAIENDADLVLLPYRRSDKDSDKYRDEQDITIYCAKQREGAAFWEIETIFNKSKQTFWTPQLLAEAAKRRGGGGGGAPDETHSRPRRDALGTI
jgi:replicative DNA helicase